MQAAISTGGQGRPKQARGGLHHLAAPLCPKAREQNFTVILPFFGNQTRGNTSLNSMPSSGLAPECTVPPLGTCSVFL